MHIKQELKNFPVKLKIFTFMSLKLSLKHYGKK